MASQKKNHDLKNRIEKLNWYDNIYLSVLKDYLGNFSYKSNSAHVILCKAYYYNQKI